MYKIMLTQLCKTRLSFGHIVQGPNNITQDNFCRVGGFVVQLVVLISSRDGVKDLLVKDIT